MMRQQEHPQQQRRRNPQLQPVFLIPVPCSLSFHPDGEAVTVTGRGTIAGLTSSVGQT